jgi:sterol desaturase/sphingolipid hydroxylase (fatty acid hydroxylase superfamily)
MIQILGLFIALAGAGAVLYSLEWLFAAVRAQPLWREDSTVDLLYGLLTPLLFKAVFKPATLACAGLLLVALGYDASARTGAGFGPVAAQPRWLIALEMFLLGDLIGYWLHRCFHHRFLWRFHAVHHSSTRLDWLSALRVHPVNDVVSKLVPAALLATLGFPGAMLAGYLAFLAFYALLLHANLDWSFGPLRYVIASPLFHRWHHTREHQGLNTNFAPLFPFYMPRRERPCRFGTVLTRVPQTFLGQLLFPFRRAASSTRPAA